MIHHNVPSYNTSIVHYSNNNRVPAPYGVSPAMRVISPQTLMRRHNKVHAFLSQVVGLTTAQREVVFRLLQYWTRYTHVYPKESNITAMVGCKKATFWRTIALLHKLGLVNVVNRYVVRKQAQISNLYLLDKLILAIAKYLAERGHHFRQNWLLHVLEMDWQTFWSTPLQRTLSPP